MLLLHSSVCDCGSGADLVCLLLASLQAAALVLVATFFWPMLFD